MSEQENAIARNVVDWMRDNQSSTYHLDDYELFEAAKSKYPQYAKKLEEIGNPFSPTPTKPLITTPKASTEADYSPAKFEGLTGFMNTADWLAGEDAPSLGMPKEFWQQAYNESMAGMLYATANGEFKYDPEEYEPSIMGEVGQFMVGLLNPVDAAMFIGLPMGGKVVGAPIANKMLTKWASKGMANGVRKKIADTPIASSIFEGIIEQGIGFGAYSSAAGAIGNASQQATRQGEYVDGDGTIDKWEVAKASTAAGAEGLLLGAVTGGTGKGIGYKFSKWRLGDDAGLSKRISKRVLNTGTQVGVEAAEFTAIPYLLHGMPLNEDGTINYEQVKHDMAHNTVLITGLKTVMNKGNLFKTADTDMKGFADSIRKTVKRKQEANQAKENVKADLEGQGADTSIIQESINKTDKRLHETLEGVELSMEKLARISELNNKDMTVKEKAEFVQLTTEMMPVLEGVYTEALMNEQFRKDIGFEEFSPEARKLLESRIELIQEARDTYNNVDSLNKEVIPESKPTTPKPKKNLAEMSDIELIDEASRLTGSSQKDLRKEYIEDKLDIMQGKKIPTLNRERLIKLLEKPKADMPTTLSHEEYVSKTPEEVGISGGSKVRKGQIDVLSKEVDNLSFKGNSSQTSNYNESKGFIESLVRNKYPNRKGGGGGKGKNFIEPSSLSSEIKDLNTFAKYLAKNNKSFLTMTDKDVASFLEGKKSTVANSLNYLIDNVKEYNPNVRGLKAEQVVSQAGAISFSEKGARVQSIGEGDFIEFTPSKTGGETRKIPITPELKGMLKDLAAANKSLGKSFDFVDADGKSHDFLFWTNEGKPVTDLVFGDFLKVASKELGQNVTKKMFRKSFATFARGKGVDQQVLNLIDQTNLTHKKVADSYFKFTENQKKQYTELLNEFISESFGTKELKPSKGDGYLTTYEIRQIANKIKEVEVFEKNRLKDGGKGKNFKSIDGKTFESMLRYFVETSVRSTDILPSADYLKNIGFEKPSTKVKPKAESKKSLKINEIDTPEKSVEYWTGKKGREAGIKLSLSKRLVDIDYFIRTFEEAGIKPNEVKRLKTERAELMKQLGLKDVKKRTDAQRIKGEVEFQGKDIQAERNKFIDEVLKKNNLTREQLKEAGLDANTLGEFGDGIIKLQRGEWQPADFYHENLHRLKAFANKTGNKSLSKLIDKAEGLGRTSKEFKEWKKKNPNRDMEEFLADVVGGKASRINFTKGMMPKLKQFVKQLVSKLKTALGAGNFNDYARVLSKKVQKGFDTSGTKFGKGVKKRTKEIEVYDTKEQAKAVKEKFGLLLENIFGKDKAEVNKYKQQFIEQLGEMAGIENPKSIKIENLSKLSGDSLEMLNSILNSDKVLKIKRQKGMIEWLQKYDEADSFQLAANIGKETQKTILKGFGVKDGDLANANLKQIKVYKNYLKELGFKELKSENWIEEAYKLEHLNEDQMKMLQEFDSWKGEAKRFSLPLESVVRSLGFNKLANKLFEHSSAESDYIGDLVRMEDSVAKAFGGGRSGKKAFEKNKDYFYLMDRERRLDKIEQNLLTKGEKNFVNKAFDKEGNFTEAPEGKALAEISNWNKIVKDRFLSALKESMTDAQFERWKSEANIKWLDSFEYITRSLTEEFKKGFAVTGRAFRNEIKKHTKKIQAEIVDQEGIVNPEARQKRILEIQQEATELARQYFMDRGNYTQTRISSRFLQSRIGKLSERVYSEHFNKEIDVYDTSYDKTIKKYALGMAKYTSNVEFFPEYIKIKGHKFKGVKSDINRLQGVEGGKKVETFLSKTVEKQLGVHKGEMGYDNTKRFANDYASMLAKLQLSFPTSGLKNLLVGNYQTLGVVKMRDFARGFVDIFDADIRRQVRETGATEVGLKHIDNQISIFGESKAINKTFDWIFAKGLMRPTENINRYIAVRAALHQQNRLVNILQTGNKASKKYINAEQRLKRFYRLTDKDISMLKENGMVGADGMKAGVDAANVSRRMGQIYQKMNTAAHIYTQGATLDLFMPDLFGQGFAKPLTLYKRMAYAATANTLRNGQISFKTGNFVRPFMPVVGAILSGKALMGFYDSMLGQTPDKENGDLWDNLTTALWKGEMLGIFSELFNPNELDDNFVTPAIYSHTIMSAKAIKELYTGQSSAKQSADTFLKGTIGAYNQIIKSWKNTGFAPGAKTYNSKFRTWRKLYSDFQREIRPTKGETLIGKDERTPYFKDFLSIFNTGTEEQFARQYALTMIALANGYYQEGYSTTGRRIRNLKEAFKEAQKTMDKKMNLLNPNKASLVDKKGISRKRTNQFRQWLLDTGNKEQFKELTSMEAEYAFKVRSFNRNKKKYFRQLNVPELMDDFNW